MDNATAAKTPSTTAQSFGQFVDTGIGADGARLGLVVLAGFIYLWPPAHRTQVWNLCSLLVGATIPLLVIAVFFPPMRLICCLALWLLSLSLRFADAVSFGLPRWLMCKWLNETPAFWSAVALQAILVVSGSLYASRALAAHVESPARFGPAVIKRLHNRATAPFMSWAREGKVLPLISPQESLRQHREALTAPNGIR